MRMTISKEDNAVHLAVAGYRSWLVFYSLCLPLPIGLVVYHLDKCLVDLNKDSITDRAARMRDRLFWSLLGKCFIRAARVVAKED